MEKCSLFSFPKNKLNTFRELDNLCIKNESVEKLKQNVRSWENKVFSDSDKVQNKGWFKSYRRINMTCLSSLF